MDSTSVNTLAFDSLKTPLFHETLLLSYFFKRMVYKLQAEDYIHNMYLAYPEVYSSV